MSALAKSIEITEQLRDGLAYTELDYLRFCADYKTTTKEQQVAYFGSIAYEQMDRRYDSECCEGCDEHFADFDSSSLCYRCQCRVGFVQGGRDDPDGYNDVPRGERE